MSGYARNVELTPEQRRARLSRAIAYTAMGVAIFSLFMVFFAWLFFAHRIVTEPGSVTVIKDQPWFFGHGGVRKEVQLPGTTWKWVTTKGIQVPSFDFKIDEPFDDLPTKMQSFIDFNSYLKIRIKNPVLMVTDFFYTGEDGPTWYRWYENAIKEQYRSIVRDVAKQYTMEEIMVNPEVMQKMETEIRAKMDALITKIGIPIEITDLSLGRASPNAEVKAEINITSANQQRVKSETARKNSELERKSAEIARAAADNAYRQAMGLNTQEFVALETAKMYSSACAKSTCIIGSVPVVVGK
jgi:regulator of protease activity HflC (stomatin/prohibitin superfamily)